MERRKFTREFKLEAVRLIKRRGVGYTQASQDLGMHQSQPRSWVKPTRFTANHTLLRPHPLHAASSDKHHPRPAVPCLRVSTETAEDQNAACAGPTLGEWVTSPLLKPN